MRRRGRGSAKGRNGEWASGRNGNGNVDWLMALPDDLDRQFEQRVTQAEDVTPTNRDG